VIAFDIDDGFDIVTEMIGTKPVRLRYKQLTADEYLEFDLDIIKLRLIGARYAPERKLPDEFEQEPVVDDDGTPVTDPNTFKPVLRYKVPDGRVLIRRLNELTPEERDRYDDMDRRDERWARAFVVRALTAHVTPLPGEIAGVETGEQLVRYLRGDKETIRRIVYGIHTLNSLTADAKKAWQSALASASGSKNNTRTPNGGPLALTASAASGTASADDGTVTTDSTAETIDLAMTGASSGMTAH
jgi:hypothetical protein